MNKHLYLGVVVVCAAMASSTFAQQGPAQGNTWSGWRPQNSNPSNQTRWSGHTNTGRPFIDFRTAGDHYSEFSDTGRWTSEVRDYLRNQRIQYQLQKLRTNRNSTKGVGIGECAACSHM